MMDAVSNAQFLSDLSLTLQVILTSAPGLAFFFTLWVLTSNEGHWVISIFFNDLFIDKNRQSIFQPSSSMGVFLKDNFSKYLLYNNDDKMILNISLVRETPSKEIQMTGAILMKSVKDKISIMEGLGFLKCNIGIGSVEPLGICFKVAGMGKISRKWQHLVYNSSNLSFTTGTSICLFLLTIGLSIFKPSFWTSIFSKPWCSLAFLAANALSSLLIVWSPDVWDIIDCTEGAFVIAAVLGTSMDILLVLPILASAPVVDASSWLINFKWPVPPTTIPVAALIFSCGSILWMINSPLAHISTLPFLGFLDGICCGGSLTKVVAANATFFIGFKVVSSLSGGFLSTLSGGAV